MNARLSNQMTLLGLAALAFYAVMLGTGMASLEVLPQFAISAVIFLSSGRIMRQVASQLPEKDEQETEEKPAPDWELRNLVLNWVAAAAVVGIVAIFLVKPAGMTFAELGQFLLQSNIPPDIQIPLSP